MPLTALLLVPRVVALARTHHYRAANPVSRGGAPGTVKKSLGREHGSDGRSRRFTLCVSTDERLPRIWAGGTTGAEAWDAAGGGRPGPGGRLRGVRIGASRSGGPHEYAGPSSLWERRTHWSPATASAMAGIGYGTGRGGTGTAGFWCWADGKHRGLEQHGAALDRLYAPHTISEAHGEKVGDTSMRPPSSAPRLSGPAGPARQRASPRRFFGYRVPEIFISANTGDPHALHGRPSPGGFKTVSYAPRRGRLWAAGARPARTFPA